MLYSELHASLLLLLWLDQAGSQNMKLDDYSSEASRGPVSMS